MTHETSIPTPEYCLTQELIANFNDEVLVKITPTGEEMWNAVYARTRDLYPDAFPIQRDEEGYTKLQLHVIANIFGPAMYNGNPHLPIEPTFKYLPKN
jgi:hypothetical protein